MSLKRQPSAEPEESPKSKRQERENDVEGDDVTAPDNTATTTPIRPSKLNNQNTSLTEKNGSSQTGGEQAGDNEEGGERPETTPGDKEEGGECPEKTPEAPLQTAEKSTAEKDGSKVDETPPPQDKAAEGKSAEDKSAEEKSAEDKSTEEKSAEKTPVEKPADEKSEKDGPEGGAPEEEKKEDGNKEKKDTKDAKSEPEKKKVGFLGAPVNNGNSIWSSGFTLSSSNYTNGSSSSSSSNIFAAAMSSAGSGSVGLFGSTAPSSSSSSSSSTSAPSSGGFVFGANLMDRVVAPAKKADEEKEDKGEEKKEEDSEKKEGESSTSKKGSEEDKISLVEVNTGEEGEKRVLQTSCKLYQFCPTAKAWVDRGGGVLRLNEKEDGSGRVTSRLVFRSKAVMKVMLNTKIFGDMFINRANLTTIRISALDGGRIGTFLLKSTRNECDRLHTALLKRRETEKQNQEVDAAKESESKGSSAAGSSAAVSEPVKS